MGFYLKISFPEHQYPVLWDEEGEWLDRWNTLPVVMKRGGDGGYPVCCIALDGFIVESDENWAVFGPFESEILAFEAAGRVCLSHRADLLDEAGLKKWKRRARCVYTDG